MKKFKLESLLRYNRSLEDKAKKELWIVAEQMQKTTDEISTLKQEIQRSAKIKAVFIAKPGINIELLKIQDNYNRSLEIKIKVNKVKLVKEQKAVELARAKLIQASVKVKTIEHLKEKQLDLFRQTQNKFEQNRLDEIAVNRFLYNKGIFNVE